VPRPVRGSKGFKVAGCWVAAVELRRTRQTAAPRRGAPACQPASNYSLLRPSLHPLLLSCSAPRLPLLFPYTH
jgi:hypothetical protein